MSADHADPSTTIIASLYDNTRFMDVTIDRSPYPILESTQLHGNFDSRSPKLDDSSMDMLPSFGMKDLGTSISPFELASPAAKNACSNVENFPELSWLQPMSVEGVRKVPNDHPLINFSFQDSKPLGMFRESSMPNQSIQKLDIPRIQEIEERMNRLRLSADSGTGDDVEEILVEEAAASAADVNCQKVKDCHSSRGLIDGSVAQASGTKVSASPVPVVAIRAERSTPPDPDSERSVSPVPDSERSASPVPDVERFASPVPVTATRAERSVSLDPVVTVELSDAGLSIGRSMEILLSNEVVTHKRTEPVALEKPGTIGEPVALEKPGAIGELVALDGSSAVPSKDNNLKKSSLYCKKSECADKKLSINPVISPRYLVETHRNSIGNSFVNATLGCESVNDMSNVISFDESFPHPFEQSDNFGAEDKQNEAPFNWSFGVKGGRISPNSCVPCVDESFNCDYKRLGEDELPFAGNEVHEQNEDLEQIYPSLLDEWSFRSALYISTQDSSEDQPFRRISPGTRYQDTLKVIDFGMDAKSPDKDLPPLEVSARQGKSDFVKQVPSFLNISKISDLLKQIDNGKLTAKKGYELLLEHSQIGLKEKSSLKLNQKTTCVDTAITCVDNTTRSTKLLKSSSCPGTKNVSLTLPLPQQNSDLIKAKYAIAERKSNVNNNRDVLVPSERTNVTNSTLLSVAEDASSCSDPVQLQQLTYLERTCDVSSLSAINQTRCSLANSRFLSYNAQMETDLLSVASALQVSSSCCVSLSADEDLVLTNESEHPLFIEMSYSSYHLNGELMEGEAMQPFYFDQQDVIPSGAVFPLKIIFAPRQSGVHSLMLKIVYTPIDDMQHPAGASSKKFVELTGIGAQPDIFLSSTFYDFGRLHYKGSKVETFQITNHSPFKTALRLIIYLPSKSADCFQFSSVHCCNMLASGLPRPVPNNILNLALEANQSADVEILCRISTAECPSDSSPELTGRVVVEVDCPRPGGPLATLNLKVTRGTAKLFFTIKPEGVFFSCSPQQAVVKIVKVENAGDVPVTVFTRIHSSELFVVSPQSFDLEPGARHSVKIRFQAPTNGETLGALEFQVINDGPLYRFPIKAICQLLQLQSDVKQLIFPATAVGSSLSSCVKVMSNMSLNFVDMVINGEDFYISTGNETVKKCKSKFVAKKLEIIKLCFRPRKAGLCDAVFKLISCDCKFSIPLRGIGGPSDICFPVNMPSLLSPTPTGGLTSTVVIENRGGCVAGVFPKIFSGKDLNNPIASVTVKPERFCLAPGKSQMLRFSSDLTTLPSNAHLAVSYADEISRKLAIRSFSQFGSSSQSSIVSECLHPFLHENLCPLTTPEPRTLPADGKLLDIRTIFMPIGVGQHPDGFINPPTLTASRKRINICLSNPDSSPTILSLSNSHQSRLRFTIEASDVPDVLLITPLVGCVHSGDSCDVLISGNPNLIHRGISLPWNGFIFIHTDHESLKISVAVFS